MTPEKKPPDQAVYTAKDIAALLVVANRTVYRWWEFGRMPAGFRVGGSRRWHRKVIDKWIAAGCPGQ